MSEPDSEFRRAVERVCSGSHEAAWEFIETYGPHIQRVVRRRLDPLLRPKFDSVDFVQMVWASFFADPKRIAAIKEPEELIRYLVAMARHKVIDESRRRLKFQKHNVHRERPLQDADQPGATSRQTLETPSQIAMAKERWRRLLRHRSERDRRIMELRMNGATFGEISQSLGIHERTAREVLACLAPGSGDQD